MWSWSWNSLGTSPGERKPGCQGGLESLIWAAVWICFPSPSHRESRHLGVALVSSRCADLWEEGSKWLRPMDAVAAAGTTGPRACCTLLCGEGQGCSVGRSGRNTCGGRSRRSTCGGRKLYSIPVIDMNPKLHCCVIFLWGCCCSWRGDALGRWACLRIAVTFQHCALDPAKVLQDVSGVSILRQGGPHPLFSLRYGLWCLPLVHSVEPGHRHPAPCVGQMAAHVMRWTDVKWSTWTCECPVPQPDVSIKWWESCCHMCLRPRTAGLGQAGFFQVQ